MNLFSVEVDLCCCCSRNPFKLGGVRTQDERVSISGSTIVLLCCPWLGVASDVFPIVGVPLGFVETGVVLVLLSSTFSAPVFARSAPNESLLSLVTVLD